MAGAGVTVFLCLFSFLSSNLAKAQDTNCSFEPVNLPIQSVVLSNHQNSIRGVYMAIGSPTQNFSFLPLVDLNNTFVYQTDKTCKDPASCLTIKGGLYEAEQSSTYVNESAPNVKVNPNFDGSEKLTDGGSFAQDTLTLLDNATISDFPFGIVNQSINTGQLTNGGDVASLGIGINSTILSILKRAGTIGSRSVGFWWGLDGATEPTQMDGNLVLGGYDRAKIKDTTNNHTDRLSTPGTCPQGMLITFTSITLNFPNGSEPNLLDQYLGSSAMTACICPGCPILMSMPLEPYYNRFEAWTDSYSIGRSVGVNFFSMMYAAGEAYQGDLTFTTDSGLNIRIPNSQLVLPDVTITNAGAVAYNTSVQDVMIYSLQDVNKNDIPRIGRYFFTAAYLHINHDDKTYTVFEANPTTDVDIVPVLDGQLAQECKGTQPKSTPAPSATSSSPTGVPSSGAAKGTKLSAGAIAGIVVGSVAIVGILAVLLWRRRSRRISERSEDAAPAKSAVGPSPAHQEEVRTPLVEVLGHEPAEMKGNPLPPLPPQELWPGRQRYKPDVHEME